MVKAGTKAPTAAPKGKPMASHSIKGTKKMGKC